MGPHAFQPYHTTPTPEDPESTVAVDITYDTSKAPMQKRGEPHLFVMYDGHYPEKGELYFTQAEWDAFVLGVKAGEFDIDESGQLPPVPEDQLAR